MRSLGWEATADAMKAPALKKDALKGAEKYVVDAIQCCRVLNHLGEQGWEMVSPESYREIGCRRWIFKRKVRP